VQFGEYKAYCSGVWEIIGFVCNVYNSREWFKFLCSRSTARRGNEGRIETIDGGIYREVGEQG